MQLNLNRLLSDRLVFDDSKPEKLRVTHSFWDWCKRIISWIWSPKCYSDENRRTMDCFRKCLINTLGKERLQRICTRYSLNLEAMEKKGSPLLSRDVAKIVIGAKNVTVEDINEFIHKAHEAGIPDERFVGKSSFLDLDSATLAGVIKGLSKPFGDLWQVADITQQISGRATKSRARFTFDPFLADRERMQLILENPTDTFEIFVHNMVARVIKREMNVGTLIPAPNHPDGRPQYYYVSAKVISGNGMISYIFHPATADTNLKPMRLFRGTSARNGEIDGISTVITDLERDLGRTAYESGEIYEPIIRQKLGQPPIEGGHSLGSAIVQYRLANMGHIEDAYLYCGPGIALKEVEKFNQKNSPVHLHIRHSTKDKLIGTGECHIGYKKPPNVIIDYFKYHSPKKRMGLNPHVTVWGRERAPYGIEGGIPPEKRDLEFYHKNNRIERFRSTICPSFAKILRAFRYVCRSLFSSRAETERGLKIGTMRNGRWQVDHFRTI